MSSKLAAFEAWLLKRGRDPITATGYRGAVRRALEYAEPTDVLLSRGLAPLYRRYYSAALRAWARFLEDGKLLARIEDIRLPPAEPKEPTQPLGEDEWFQLIDALEGSDMPPARRLALSVVAVRGIRIGDVVRLRRSEIQTGVTTGTLPFEAKRGRRLRFAVLATRPYLAELLELQWRGRAQLRELIVGPGRNQQKQATRALRRELAKVCVDLGMDPQLIHPHRFRPTAAQEFLRHAENDPEAVLKLKDWFQWSNLNTAMSYLHRDRRKELDAVEQKMLESRRRRKA